MEYKRPPESDQIEYKREMTNSFLKTVSAFANFGDGTIEFGINDDRTIQGLKNPLKFADDLTNKINDNIKPIPDYEISIDENSQTVLLSVHKGFQTPYLYNHKAYQRRNTSTVEVGNLTLQDLILQGRNMTFDELPAYQQQLTFRELEREVIEKLGVERLGSDTLISLGLADKNGYNRAAELLADQNQYSGIDVAVFGENINTIRKRQTIDHVSVLMQYNQALEIFKNNYQKEVIQGFERRQEEEIPETAFREALANALIHRNWAVPGHIQIHMFKDHLEIHSPGGLPEGASKESYLSDSISIPRNPRLTYIFFRLNLIERLGTGIRRIKESYREFSVSPSFGIYDSSITVNLPIITASKARTEEQQNLLNRMNPNILYSRRDLEVLTGLSRAKVTRLVNEMQKADLIQVKGAGRSTKYIRNE